MKIIRGMLARKEAADVTPEQFCALPKARRSDLIRESLFVRRTPPSIARDAGRFFAGNFSRWVGLTARENGRA
jgi:hypothetical protein